MALKRRQQAAQLLRNFIGDKAAEPIIQAGRDFVEGAKTGADVMTARGDRRHSVFSKDYYKDITQGNVGIGKKARANPYNVAGGRNVDYVTKPITFKDNPAGFLGAYGARLFTDIGTDSSRQFYWKYNHPMALAEKAIEQAVPALGDIKLALLLLLLWEFLILLIPVNNLDLKVTRKSILRRVPKIVAKLHNLVLNYLIV